MLSRLDPRPAQIDILEYTHGRMGISAVPGSGKTHTLSALAATLLVEERLRPDQEVLVVTLVNSAVRNFSQRIAWFIDGEGLIPDIGYRVRTLHGLAHDILMERPDLAGLSDHFQIIDEREADQILDDAAANWLKTHPEFYDLYLNPEIDSNKRHKIEQDFTRLISNSARAFIRIAKDQQITSPQIRQQLAGLAHPPLLLQMGADIYEDYQRALAYRSAVDFDDLIRLALGALQTDPDFLLRLRDRWPYILEDEAQDSSRLQEEILTLLTGPEGNWVRVGDPNQAIYETFTTANPRYLLDFMNKPGVRSLSLPNSGRSTQSIIDLANYLIDWVSMQDTHPALKYALTGPHIQPSPLGDPQPNPTNFPDGIFLSHIKYDPDKEVEAVVKSVRRWLPDHPNETAAILTPRNERGDKVVAALKEAGIKPIELLRSTLSTRQTAELLASILHYLDEPATTQRLIAVYHLLRRPEEEQKETAPLIQAVAKILRSCTHLEDYLAPHPDLDWLAEVSLDELPEPIQNELETLRNLILPWQKATTLPIDQLLLTIAQDIFSKPSDLALSHKLALLLETISQNHPEWRLPEFIIELNTIAHNERKFLGFAEEDTGFDPDEHRGKVVVATIHKAKGLEWDRVYLMSVNNYDFPALDPYDTYFSEKWFIRNQLNLEAETLSLLNGLIRNDPAALNLEEGVATLIGREAYVQERLRLLFVGITRARRELVGTWNTGKRGTAIPALPLLELQRYWENIHE